MRAFLIILVFSIAMMAATAVTNDISSLTPVYASQGFMSWEESDFSRNAIANRETLSITVPQGATGDNVYLGADGRVRVIINYSCPYPRQAKLIHGLVYFDSCGNLFRWSPPVEKPQEVCPPPAPKEQIIVTSTIMVICKPEPEKRLAPAFMPPPVIDRQPAPVGISVIQSSSVRSERVLLSGWLGFGTASGKTEPATGPCDPNTPPPSPPPPSAADMPSPSDSGLVPGGCPIPPPAGLPVQEDHGNFASGGPPIEQR